MEAYLQTLASVSEIVAPILGGPIVLKDVDDDPIIYTAVAGKAEVLCTRDAHFYETSVRNFCSHIGTAIMDDVALLQVLRKK